MYKLTPDQLQVTYTPDEIRAADEAAAFRHDLTDQFGFIALSMPNSQITNESTAAAFKAIVLTPDEAQEMVKNFNEAEKRDIREANLAIIRKRLGGGLLLSGDLTTETQPAWNMINSRKDERVCFAGTELEALEGAFKLLKTRQATESEEATAQDQVTVVKDSRLSVGQAALGFA